MMGSTPLRLFFRRYRWLIVVLVVVLVGLVVWLKARPTKIEGASTAVAQGPTAKVLELLASDVQVVEPVDFQLVLPLSGSINAHTQSVVKSYIGGEVKAIRVREGQTVQANEVVAEIDSRETQARLDQAKAALRAAEGQLAMARQTQSNNQALLEQGFIAKTVFDNSQNQWEIAKANVESAQAAVELAQKSRADTILRAPIAGTVAHRWVQVGEKVSPDARLIDLVDLNDLELEAAIPATDIGRISLGQKIHFTVAGVSNHLVAQVVRINPATETGSRSILLYAKIAPAQSKALRVGMFAQGKIIVRAQKLLAVPEAAIQTREGKTYVFVIEQGVLRERAVSLGALGEVGSANYVEVTKGLAAKDQMIKVNLGNLALGSKIQIATAP